MRKTLEIEPGRAVYLVHREYGAEMQALQSQVADCARKILKDLEGNPSVDDLKYRLQAGKVIPQMPLGDIRINMNMAGVLFFDWDEPEVQPVAIAPEIPPVGVTKTPETPPKEAKAETETPKSPLKPLTLARMHEMAKERGITEMPYGGNAVLFNKVHAEKKAAKEAEAEAKANEETAAIALEAEKKAAATPKPPAPATKKVKTPVSAVSVPAASPTPKRKKMPEDDGMDEDLSSLFKTLEIPDDDGNPDAFKDNGEEADGDGFVTPSKIPPMDQILKEATEFDLDELIGQDLKDDD